MGKCAIPGPYKTVESYHGMSGDSLAHVSVVSTGYQRDGHCEVARVKVIDRCNTNARETRDSAAFIVRAMNCHGEMLEALKVALQYLDELGRGPGREYPNPVSELLAVTIAKAEGR